MAENKDKDIIVDIDIEQANNDKGLQDIGFHGEEELTQSPNDDDLKQQTGEMLKAVGGLASSFGRFAVKKGTDLKNKIEDEEFQEKIKTNIKEVTDRIDDYVSSEPTKGKIVNVKGSINTSNKSNDTASNVDSEENVAIKTDFEVEGVGDITFETTRPKKGVAKAIEQKKEERARKKAEEERIRKEQERLPKEKDRRTIVILCVLGIAIFALLWFMTSTDASRHEGEIHPPISSDDLVGLNYEDVANEFISAGFTDVKTLKKEDLVLGWLSSDGEVERVTIADSEDFSTSYWYSPEEKVIIYYHTFPEDIETAEKVKEEADEELKNDADRELLESFIGMTCAEADSKVKEAGFTPIYLAANNRTDMTDPIQSDEELANNFKIYEVDGIIDKSVYFKVKSQEMVDQEKNAAEIERKMKDHRAMSIVQLYGEKQLPDFDLKYITCQAQVSGNGWDIYGECTYKDAYGNNHNGECVAHVNADTEEVELFEVR